MDRIVAKKLKENRIKRFEEYYLSSMTKNPETNDWLVCNVSIFGSHHAYYAKTKKQAYELCLLVKKDMIRKFNKENKVNQSKALSLLSTFDFTKNDHADKTAKYEYV